MAEVVIVEEHAPYYVIDVTIYGQTYRQTIITDKTGAELDALLAQYAADYEAALSPE